ncbi:MAG: CHAT domain-containing tetratricopeptide repeat protein [Chloroflexota bacterium]
MMELPVQDVKKVALWGLALMGWATDSILSLLIQRELAAEFRLFLVQHPSLSWQNGRFVIDQEFATQHLSTLEHEDYVLYTQVQQYVLDQLSQQLIIGNVEVEENWLIVYKRLAGLLVSDNPEAFTHLVNKVETIALSQDKSQHLQKYFLGLSFGLNEEFEQALVTFEDLLLQTNLEDDIRGRTLNSRAIFYRLTGQMELALADSLASLTLWQKLEDEERIGLAMVNVGFIAYHLRQYDIAETSLQQGTELLEQLNLIRPVYLANMNLGILYRDLGRWEEAMACQQRAAAFQRKGKTVDMLGRTLINIGEIALLQGDLEEAKKNFEEALQLMSTRIWQVDAYLDLGLVFQTQGMLQRAEEIYRNALALVVDIGRDDVLAEVNFRIGEVARLFKRDAIAWQTYVAAANIIEKAANPIKNESVKVSLLGRWQQVYEGLVLQCLAMGRVAEAFDWAEKARARAFAEALGGDEASGGTTTAVSLQRTLAETAPNTLILSYFTTGVLEHDIPMLKKIPEDNPLLQHLLTEPKTILFLIAHDRIEAHDCQQDPNFWTEMGLRGNNPQRWLHPRFVRYFSPKLLGAVPQGETIKKMVIVPHGPLHTMPFGGLLWADKRPFIHPNAPTITYAPSATVWQQQRPSGPHESSGFALGFPGNQRQQRLRYTAAEVATVAQLLDGEAQGEGVVDKEWLRQTAVSQKILHFACHAWFNQKEPLASYLEIGPETHLTAQEVLADWRLTADFVVLSACQTGVSKVLRGDEPMGLIRAFLYAGANAVLVAHWPVEDLPTFLLMTRFYQAWQEREDVAWALREAQVWLREADLSGLADLMAESDLHDWQADLPPRDEWEGERPFADARHWAAFTLFGA